MNIIKKFFAIVSGITKRSSLKSWIFKTKQYFQHSLRFPHFRSTSFYKWNDVRKRYIVSFPEKIYLLSYPISSFLGRITLYKIPFFLYIFSKFKPWLIKGNGKLLKKGVHCIFSSFPPYFPRCLYSAVNHSYRCYDNSNFRPRFPQISLLIGCCWSLVVAVAKWRLLECDPPQSPWLKKTPTWSGASRANILPLSWRISLLFELSETTSIPLPSGSS